MAAINSASADVCPISLLPPQRHSSGPNITLSEPAKTGTRGTLYAMSMTPEVLITRREGSWPPCACLKAWIAPKAKGYFGLRAWFWRIRNSPSFLSLVIPHEGSGQFERP